MNVPKVKAALEQFRASLAERFPDYEPRPEQQKMVNQILNGLYAKRHVLVEAGTGTGKSLAYLLAILSALAAGEEHKAVISTHTINLQEQLLNKDIPLLQEIFSGLVDFKVALAKGRNNYLCRRKLQDILASDEPAFESLADAQEFSRLKDLLFTDGTFLLGDRSELAVNVSSSLWSTLASSQDTCLERRCPLIKECFFRIAREALREADIVISNHALFFTDLALRGSADSDEGILPPYDLAILDEAHHIEDVASQALSVSVDGYRLKTAGGRLRALIAKGAIHEMLTNEPLLSQSLEATVKSYFDHIDVWLQRLAVLTEGRSIVRLPLMAGQLDNPLEDDLKEISQYLEHLQATPGLSDDEEAELEKAQIRWQALSRDIEFLLKHEHEDYVYWAESPLGDYTQGALKAVPIEMAGLLRETLFSRELVAVLTSATLATPSLRFMAERLGVDDYLGKVLSSPFDHQQNAAVYVPEGACEPNYQNNLLYEKYLGQLITEVCRLTQGGTFVLFTSYQMMNSLFDRVAPHLRLLNLELFRQGDLPRHELLNAYKSSDAGVLFGTSSFWEGVDVVGDGLRCVIITKLPFAVPDHPITEARMEALAQRGVNPFMHYQLPEAIIKLKQGYGRLIRSQSDRGAVVIADGRVFSKRYGKLFLEALPTRNILRDTEEFRRFMERG
ncbi:MAG: ATP-dependent DNA helicase [Bacillota bacterium]